MRTAPRDVQQEKRNTMPCLQEEIFHNHEGLYMIVNFAKLVSAEFFHILAVESRFAKLIALNLAVSPQYWQNNKCELKR